MNSLSNKVAIITGGGTGIGRGIAVALAGESVITVICGRRKDRLEETLQQIHKLDQEGLVIAGDISQYQDVDRIVKTTLAQYHQIDILINNAGISSTSPIHSHDVALWTRVMDVNLCGAFLMTRAVLPFFREQADGHIINISSESGLEYYPGNGAYGVSKHALNALGEYVQRENQEMNIRVNTICPGMVISEMTEQSPGLDHSKCLYPDDIADLVVWLLSRRKNIKIGTPILIQTMQNPWKTR